MWLQGATCEWHWRPAAVSRQLWWWETVCVSHTGDYLTHVPWTGRCFQSIVNQWSVPVDYYSAVLARSARFTTDKLQQVMNSVVSNTWKFDNSLSRLLHDELHWLDVTDRVRFKLAVLMYRSLHGTAPLYLVNSCTPTADVSGRQHLRSTSQRKLIVPSYRLNSFGRRCFAVAGLSTWNSLPHSLLDPAPSLNMLRRQLKTYCFAKYWRDVLSALEIFWKCTI